MIADVFADIATSSSVAAVQETFLDEATQHGYVSAACRILCRTRGGAAGATYLFKRWPEEWQAVSAAARIEARSPVQAAVRLRHEPFTWRDVCLAPSISPDAASAMAVAWDWGWTNGFVVPVHGPGGYIASIGMASRERDLDLGPARRQHLHLLGLLAHQRCLDLTLAASRAGKTLTTREQDCMRWVAEGKTDWEIGMILGIGAATVKVHVDSARRKLGASTRAHAVARLISGGLF